MKKGKLFLISGPSGSGKTTLRKMLQKDYSTLIFSVSYTSRPKREDETEGKDYFFVTRGQFEEMIGENEFIEWALVYNHYKGTSKKVVREILDKGNNVLLELDVQGGENVIKLFPDVCSIFILPPSLEVLLERFEKRNTDSPEQMEIRMKNAKFEISKKLIYQFRIINNDIDQAYKELCSIIDSFLAE